MKNGIPDNDLTEVRDVFPFADLACCGSRYDAVRVARVGVRIGAEDAPYQFVAIILAGSRICSILGRRDREGRFRYARLRQQYAPLPERGGKLRVHTLPIRGFRFAIGARRRCKLGKCR